MAEQGTTPLYLHANAQDIASLVNKLTQFSQTLSPVELSLLMERIKRSMPNMEVDGMGPIAASPAVFGAWLNAIVDGESRWYPT
jgi:hypothetical protein